MQARNWLPWQSVEVRSKGRLKTMAFRSQDGKQHLSFLALELGDRRNNSCSIDRESFEFSLLPLCTWSNRQRLKGWCAIRLPVWYNPHKNCCNWNIWKHKVWKKTDSRKGKWGNTKRVLTQGPCHSGMRGLQRKNKGRREIVFSANMLWMGCTKTLKTHF